MSRKIVYNENARKMLERGMKILAQAVSLTLGPKGRNVLIETGSGVPQIVNDGLTIAQEIELMNSLENMGVALLRQAASKTNSVVGDGTTTSTVLAYGIVHEGLKIIASGSNPVLVKKGIEKAVHFIVSNISHYSRPVESIDDIIHVASISAGNDADMGRMIAQAIKHVGREGVISFQDSSSSHTYLEITEGMRIDKGLMSPYFLTQSDGREICQDRPLILLIDERLGSSDSGLIHVLERAAIASRPLLIVANDIDKEPLAVLITNRLRGILDVVAVRTPGFGDTKRLVLEDLAVLTGAQIVSDRLGLALSEISLDMMGSARRVTVSRHAAQIISEDNRENVYLRCRQLIRQIDSSSNTYQREQLQKRLSKLSGGVAVIKVGGMTEAEIKHRKLRFEDAVSATRAAIDEGIVPGGGAALFHLGKKLTLLTQQPWSPEELAGVKIVSTALSLPLFTIIQNTGLSPVVIVNQINDRSFFEGYNAKKSVVANMYQSGIIDPAKVTRLALQNASSVASVILTTECIIDGYAVDKNL